MIPGIAGAAGKGLQTVVNSTMKPVIGRTTTTVRTTKKTVKTTQSSISFNVWELGILGAGAGLLIGGISAYEYLTSNPISNLTKVITTTLKNPKTQVDTNTITYGIPLNWYGELTKDLNWGDIF